MFDQLSLLDTSRTTWNVKVRITRMWPSIASSAKGNGGLKGYNLILLDDDNFHVQAYVYADQWNSVADKIVEGGLYVISNFYTKEALGSLKPVSSRYLINFSPSTTIERVEEDDFMIPRHKFEFLDLGDLFGIASSYPDTDFPPFSVDLIGVIEDFENVSDIKTKYGDRKIVKFRITDGRHSHKVSVWGEHAVNLDSSYREITEKPIIVILASTKLKTFRSSVQITTLPSSKIYLNLDIDIVTEMKLRLEEEGYTPSQSCFDSFSPTSVVSGNPPAEQIEIVSLKELSEKTSTEYVERYFLCKVKVINVEETDNWWYQGCLECCEEVTKMDGTYKCTNSSCKKNNPLSEKRYRILILAEDDSEAYNFVLLDRAAKRIIGKTATNLISENIKSASPNAFPSKIKEMSGNELTLKVQVRSDNVLLNSSIYYAADAFYSRTFPSPALQKNSPDDSNTSYGDINVYDLSGNGNTPGSAKSSNKKPKMEK